MILHHVGDLAAIVHTLAHNHIVGVNTLENAIAQQRGRLGIIPDKVECDYFDWCNGKRKNNVWQGEYMVQYSWSEDTAGVLNEMSKNEK